MLAESCSEELTYILGRKAKYKYIGSDFGIYSVHRCSMEHETQVFEKRGRDRHIIFYAYVCGYFRAELRWHGAGVLDTVPCANAVRPVSLISRPSRKVLLV